MKIKNVLIIATIVLLLVGVGIVIFFKIVTPSTPPPPTDGTQSTLPTTNPTTVTPTTPGDGQTDVGVTQVPMITVLAVNGRPVSVKDFKTDPTTYTTPNIPGHYFLAGGLDPNTDNAPYSIFYVESDQSFNISLWVEPIAETRRAAEQVLLQNLGVQEYVACTLRYSVLVTYNVNPLYSSKNLGFSFCPGATQLN